ncbi:hypothetical protein D3C86_895370 [compost metagenome]
MTTALSEIPPPGAFETHLLGIVIRRDAVFSAQLATREVAIDADVNDTRDGARTPGGRGAACHDVDALHQNRWNTVQVVFAGHATTVDQNQGPADAQAAQIDRRIARAGVGARRLWRGGGPELRHVVQGSGDVGARPHRQVFGRQAYGRGRRREAGAIDPRCGDHDFIDGGGAARGLFVLGLGDRAAGAGQQGDSATIAGQVETKSGQDESYSCDDGAPPQGSPVTDALTASFDSPRCHRA